MSGRKKTVIMGAGLSGLCAARTIQRAGGLAELYEASDGVGGRVRTDVVDGFRLDRGFQVLFTAYPAIRQEMDEDALHIRAFAPGAIVFRDGRRSVVADPLREPARIVGSALSPLFPPGDKLNVARLRLALGRMSVKQIFDLPDQTMGDYLRQFGFTAAFLDNFIRPFYGGIFLERNLETSARMFAFVFKMLAEGRTAVPALGMGALGEQIADGLTPGTLHLNAPVAALRHDSDRMTGIQLADGREIEADNVIVATDADTTARLTGLPLPITWRVSTCVYFALPHRLYREKLICLFADPGSQLANATLMSNISLDYAPHGEHLLAATVLGDPDLSDDALAELVKAELAPHFPRADPDTWRLLRVYRVRWAQYAQTPGIWSTLPTTHTDMPGLILAGEITTQSSLHGALVAGQRAAGLALSHHNP